MADDKKISITITSQADTAGFQQATDAAKETKDAVQDLSHGGMPGLVPPGAVEEIKEVGKAIEEVGNKAPAIDPLEKALASIDEKAARASEELEDLTKDLDRMAEEAKEGAEATEELGGKVDRVVQIQKAQIAQEIAQGLAMVGERMRDAANEFRAADPDLARVLDDTAGRIDIVSGAMSGAAQGFALSGPFGAAVGGLIGGALGPLSDALEDAQASLVSLAQSEAFATEVQKSYQDAIDGTNEKMFEAQERSEELTKAHENELTALDALIDGIERRNRVQDAQDKADKAARDRADQTAIAGGAAPEDVRIKRAKDDEAAALAKIEREIQDKGEAAQAAVNATQAVAGNLSRMQGTDGATPEQITKLGAELDEARARAERLLKDLNEAKETADPRRQEIRETTAGRIEDLQRTRDARTQREYDRDDEAAIRRGEKEYDERVADNRRRQQEKERGDGDRRRAGETASSVGRDALAIAERAGASADALQRLRGAAADANRDPNERTFAAMEKLLEQLGPFIARAQGRDSGDSQKVTNLERKIEALGRQLTNLSGRVK